ncbi:MAG: hypothetical protein M3137_13860 [Actinomycetota bacterium]|nr:hypothetical protein [Actinomycetota bacterium]
MSEARSWSIEDVVAPYAPRDPEKGERSEDVEQWLERLHEKAADPATWDPERDLPG